MKLSLRSAVVAFTMLATVAWTQDGPDQPGINKEILANGGLLHTLLAAPVTGHPYSAVQVHTSHRKLADGTEISHQGHHLVARDGVGRVHVELRLGTGRSGQPDPAMVFVLDPLAHTLTTWRTGAAAEKKEAITFKLPADLRASQRTPADTGAPADRMEPKVTVEDLGTDTVEGVPVSVRRTTTIVPIGRSGNDAPITKTHEVWTSADLQLAVKEQWIDPRSGIRTVELSHLTLSEPDPALFHPPSGYEVKDARQTLKELEKKMDEGQLQ